jgi:energy-coupling factor transporter transmembrane protein EcfT
MNLYLLFLPIYANNLFVLMIIFLYITFMKENKNIKSRKLYLITSFFVFTLIFGL